MTVLVRRETILAGTAYQAHTSVGRDTDAHLPL
jgi:hypothetical protein